MNTHKGKLYWAMKIANKGWRAFWRPRIGATAHYTELLFPTQREANEAARTAIEDGVGDKIGNGVVYPKS
jgi:hypothetical protein